MLDAGILFLLFSEKVGLSPVCLSTERGGHGGGGGGGGVKGGEGLLGNFRAGLQTHTS